MKAALPLLPALLLAACGQGQRDEPAPANNAAEINALAADIEGLENDVRIRRLEERIGVVEAQLGNVTMRDADVDDLEKRMIELEAIAGSAAAAKPSAPPRPKPTP